MESTSDCPRELAVAVIKLTTAFRRCLRRLEGADDMSWPRLMLLGALVFDGPQKMSDLSEALEVTPRNITALVDALEHEGIVNRRPHPTDRRATLIEPTPDAVATYQPMFERKLGDAARVFGRLSESDQRELRRIIGLLLESPELA